MEQQHRHQLLVAALGALFVAALVGTGATASPGLVGATLWVAAAIAALAGLVALAVVIQDARTER